MLLTPEKEIFLFRFLKIPPSSSLCLSNLYMGTFYRNLARKVKMNSNF